MGSAWTKPSASIALPRVVGAKSERATAWLRKSSRVVIADGNSRWAPLSELERRDAEDPMHRQHRRVARVHARLLEHDLHAVRLGQFDSRAVALRRVEADRCARGHRGDEAAEQALRQLRMVSKKRTHLV